MKAACAALGWLRAPMWLAASLLVAACAASVPAVPVTFAAAQPGRAGYDVEVRQATIIKLGTGYSRELPLRSRWRPVGSIAQGTVYQPVGTVFSIEGRNVHEAYLVIKDGALQGFYLPGESNFSPLQPSLPLTLGDPS